MKAFLLLLFALSSNFAYSYCFEEAAKEYDLPSKLLIAIAKVESNMRPDVVNYNKNGSFDYGLMQINSSWYYELGKERWNKIADPCENVKTGAMILSRCISQYGFNWKAVDCYNKGSKSRSYSNYILKIF
ncbi:MAG: lytic transglycosylase domain-containing protein, partial [Calditerrivibrio sp.]|nr:lytic transglycosylase domain-containing protein [Calditerrivibrio sp.]MCA1980661.1 lytic transglycosylase domain-containing protein [Calditerrivibrio sp.]